jgi:hypothetical protein
MATAKTTAKTTAKKAPKSSGKSAKAATTATTARTRKVAAKKALPGEEDIRLKAQEIYNDRISRGEHGTAEEDWLKAEKQLKG